MGKNRFKGSQIPVTGLQLSFCWNYDSFGNRLTQATSPSPFGGTPGVDCTTRATGTLTSNAWVHYNTNNQATEDSQSVAPKVPDASGNMGADGTYQYLYDAEGRVCAVETLQSPFFPVGYLYDAEGQRVAKGKLSQFSCNLATNGFTVTNEYLHDASGGQLTEFDGQGPVATYQCLRRGADCSHLRERWAWRAGLGLSEWVRDVLLGSSVEMGTLAAERASVRYVPGLLWQSAHLAAAATMRECCMDRLRASQASRQAATSV